MSKSVKSVKPSKTIKERGPIPVIDAGDEFCSAVIANDLAKVKKMIRRGEDINKKTKLGFTPLYLAAFYGYSKVLKYLLRQDEIEVDATIKYNGETVLHAAIMQGKYEIVENLIRCSGRSLEIKDMYGKTPLHYAVLLAESSNLDSIKILNLVAAKSDNIDARDNEGNTALHYAASSGSSAAIICLLFYSAKLLLKNKAGKTPVDVSKGDWIKDIFTVCKVIDSTPSYYL